MQQNSTIVSALCWVSRGYAKPTLTEYQPTEAELKQHKKMSKKLLKAKTEKKDDKKDGEDEMSDDSGEPDMPNFTAEIAALKDKELGTED